nr:MAG TPA_asm: hypothetical protein [Caudoviricetes sp.]
MVKRLVILIQYMFKNIHPSFITLLQKFKKAI